MALLDVGVYIEELIGDLVRVNDVSDRIGHHVVVDQGLTLGLGTMVPLGLLLNELITNSFKHAFHGRDKGTVSLSLHRADGNQFDLIYGDDGTGIPQDKIQNTGETLGVSLIESLVEQLSGRMSVDGDPSGTRYHIRFTAR